MIIGFVGFIGSGMDSYVTTAPIVPRHVNNVGAVSCNSVAAWRENKNAHAVALGKMSSPAKAKAAQKNGAKGGRPVGS